MTKINNRNSKIVASAMLCGLFAAAVAFAGGKGPVKAKASLSGFEEVPSIVTPGSGKFTATIDSVTQEIHWELSYSDLEGVPMQAHIHIGNKATNGAVTAFLCTNLGNAPAQVCPNSPGTVSGTIAPSDILGPANQGVAAGDFDSLLKAIQAGATYVNLHSTTFLSGELRGQVKAGKSKVK